MDKINSVYIHTLKVSMMWFAREAPKTHQPEPAR